MEKHPISEVSHRWSHRVRDEGLAAFAHAKTKSKVLVIPRDFQRLKILGKTLLDLFCMAMRGGIILILQISYLKINSSMENVMVLPALGEQQGISLPLLSLAEHVAFGGYWYPPLEHADLLSWQHIPFHSLPDRCAFALRVAKKGYNKYSVSSGRNRHPWELLW